MPISLSENSTWRYPSSPACGRRTSTGSNGKGDVEVESDLRVQVSPVGPVVRPPGHAEAVILYLHGNSDVAAGPESGLERAKHLALHAGSTVVCARYRSAFPDALEDVHAAYRYCETLGPVSVAGERMGAGLAAALLIRLRDTGAALPRCAVLVSALLDLTMQAKSLSLNASADPTFDVIALRRRVADYAGDAPLTNALVSPVYANLYGLPPVQLIVAGTDPLLDDSLAFATRAARSHLTVDLRVWSDTAELRADAVPVMADFIAGWQQAPLTTASRMVSG